MNFLKATPNRLIISIQVRYVRFAIDYSIAFNQQKEVEFSYIIFICDRFIPICLLSHSFKFT